ncbi:MAG: ribonuclease Z [Bacteroidales bacterium]
MVFELTILGTSSALPTSTRYPTAHVLNVHERFFLIDCGEGTQMRLRQNRIRIGKIHDIFISHTHGDHVFGLYGLISTLNLTGCRTPLTIYAPEGFGEMISSHLADFDIRLEFDIIHVPLTGNDPSVILDNNLMTVTSFPLKHRVPTYGFLFREKQLPRNIRKESISRYSIPLAAIPGIKSGLDFTDEKGNIIPNGDITIDPPVPRSYAYCSDTAWFSRLPGLIRGVDMLYHEATFGSDKSDLARQTGHSTSAEAARVAAEAGAGRLIIGHFSARYKSVDQLVKEACDIFPETVAAVDGETYTL